MVQWRRPSDMSGRGVLGFVLASVALAWLLLLISRDTEPYRWLIVTSGVLGYGILTLAAALVVFWIVGKRTRNRAH